jgi:hypothetical protein
LVLARCRIERNESDVDRFGVPVSTRRLQRIAMRRLTLGTQGLTEPHFDVSADGVTKTAVLVSLGRGLSLRLDQLRGADVTGYRADRCRARPGVDGAGDLSQGPLRWPEPSPGRQRRRSSRSIPRRPQRAVWRVVHQWPLQTGERALRFKRCRFSDLPGQEAPPPSSLGPADPAGTFQPHPVKARVIVKTPYCWPRTWVYRSQTSAAPRCPSLATSSSRSASASRPAPAASRRAPKARRSATQRQSLHA